MVRPVRERSGVGGMKAPAGCSSAGSSSSGSRSVGGFIVIVGLFLALGSGASHRGRPVALSPPSRKVARKQPPAQVAAAPASRQRPAPPTLAILAARGDCWLLVRAGSASGPVVYEGTLRRGRSLTFALRFLWLRLGAPASVDVRVRGALVPGLSTLAPRNLLVGPSGARFG